MVIDHSIKREFSAISPSRRWIFYLITLMVTSTLFLSHTNLQFQDYSNLRLFLGSTPVLSYRIQLWYEGKCVGTSPDSSLQVMFCNPREEQYFQLLPDGRLTFENIGSDFEGKCLELMNTSLVIGDCNSAIKLDLVNGSYLRLQDPQKLHSNEERCLSPVTLYNEDLVPNSSPANGDPVSLTTCNDTASRITLIEENYFQKSRKYLLLPLPETEAKCDFPACGINKIAPRATPLPPEMVDRCYNLSLCVTVVTKSARRPHFVLRMVKSMSEKYPDLTVIAYDDGVGEFSSEIMDGIASYPNLNYIIGDKEDLGIAQGRNLALKHVKTKYFFLVDDDNMFTNKTHLELLVDVLDTTDATLVGGAFATYKDFASYLTFGYSMNKRKLIGNHGDCLKENVTIPNFPTCVRCELTSNDFMARTRDIVEVGGWSQELKVIEHKDLFIRLKAAGKKVVYCPDVKVYNKRPSKKGRGEEYAEKRYGRGERMKHLFNSRWNIDRFGN